MRQRIVIYMMLMMVLTGCGEYQALLKSRDHELKYEKAIEYFNKKEYTKSQTLLEDVSSYYRGTERSEVLLVGAFRITHRRVTVQPHSTMKRICATIQRGSMP